MPSTQPSVQLATNLVFAKRVLHVHKCFVEVGQPSLLISSFITSCGATNVSFRGPHGDIIHKVEPVMTT